MFSIFWWVCNLGLGDIPWFVNALIYTCFFIVDLEIGFSLYKKFWKIK